MNSKKFIVFQRDRYKDIFKEILIECDHNMSHSEIVSVINQKFVNRKVYTSKIKNNLQEIFFYRITTEYDGFESDNPSHYSHPPENRALLNRANIKGKPVFYCSLDPFSAFKEMKDKIKKGERYFISKWSLNNDLIVHNLMYNKKLSKLEHKLNPFYESIQRFLNLQDFGNTEIQEDFIYFIQGLNDLLVQEGSEVYHITSAYCHDLLYSKKEIDAILYPSVENNMGGINLAISPDSIKNGVVELKEIYCCIHNIDSSDNVVEGTIEKIAEFNGDELKWYQNYLTIHDIDVNSLKIITFNNSIIKGDHVMNLKMNGSFLTFREVVMPVVKDRVVKKIREFPRKIEVFTTLTQEYEEMIEIDFNHGYEVETERGISCVKTVCCKVEFRESFR